MTTSSRRVAFVLAIFVAISGKNACCQEAEKADPASANQEPSAAAQETPQYKKPRRGPAPTLDRISGTTYDVNPDGTMTRRTEILGQPIAGRDTEPPADVSSPALNSDPSYTPPERAAVGSINDSPPADASAVAATPAAATETRTDYSLLAGAGVCVLIVVVLWLAMRQPRRIE